MDDYIYKSRLGSGTWKEVWVPVVPADEDLTGGRDAAIKVFLYAKDVEGEAGVIERFGQLKLRGMIDPNGSKPGIIGRWIIKNRYPRTDTKNCLIFVAGKEPAGVMKFTLYVIGFIVGAAVTGALCYYRKAIDSLWENSTDSQQPKAQQPRADHSEESIFLDD
ncbi:MAG: hypothetical protein JSS02_17560 [Planctomycetes bacterium]|nr:hypothetical protein [Planctomycetota bacterium]